MSKSLHNQLHAEIPLRNIPSQPLTSICTKRHNLRKALYDNRLTVQKNGIAWKITFPHRFLPPVIVELLPPLQRCRSHGLGGPPRRLPPRLPLPSPQSECSNSPASCSSAPGNRWFGTLGLSLVTLHTWICPQNTMTERMCRVVTLGKLISLLSDFAGLWRDTLYRIHSETVRTHF